MNELCGEVIALRIDFEKGDGEKMMRIMKRKDTFKEVLYIELNICGDME
ncbi:MAG: hypothetical protein IJW71_01740 [Clostridia bacterium]|nr:hypothetical protein [Clostridia bacterium]